MLKFRIQQQQLQALFAEPYKYILVLQKLFIIMVQEYELNLITVKLSHFVHNSSRHDIYDIYSITYIYIFFFKFYFNNDQ